MLVLNLWKGYVYISVRNINNQQLRIDKWSDISDSRILNYQSADNYQKLFITILNFLISGRQEVMVSESRTKLYLDQDFSARRDQPHYVELVNIVQ